MFIDTRLILLIILPSFFEVVVIAADSSSTVPSDASKTSSSTYDLPTLFLDSVEYKIFYTNVSVGTPSQDLQLRIDLIQENSWLMDSEYFITCDERYDSNKTNQTALNTPDVDYDIAADNVCATQGVFNISQSSSALYLNTDSKTTNDSTSSALLMADVEEMNYIEVAGRVMQDTFHFTNESVTAENMYFIAANYTNVLAGGLGLAADGYGSNFLQSLVDNDVITSSSYSLYLGRMESLESEIHLGGLDTSKMSGDFVEFDFIPYVNTDGSVQNNIPIVPLTGISVTSGGSGLTAAVGRTDSIYPAMLDSRTYYSYLPYDTVIDLALQLNAVYTSDLERWLVDCEIAELDATVDFKFGNLTLSIALSEMVYVAYDDDDNQLKFQSSGNAACYVSVLPQEEEGLVLLGTPFLRSIYLAVDNEGKKLAMAKSVAAATADDDNDDEDESVSKVLSSQSARTSSSSSSSKSSVSASVSSKESAQEKAATSNILALSSTTAASSDHATTTTTKSSSSLKTWGSTKTSIVSGTIPFATPNNITSYSTLTLTRHDSASATSSITGNAIVSNGEIVLKSTDSGSTSGGGGTASGSGTADADASNAVSSSNGGSNGKAVKSGLLGMFAAALLSLI